MRYPTERFQILGQEAFPFFEPENFSYVVSELWGCRKQ